MTRVIGTGLDVLICGCADLLIRRFLPYKRVMGADAMTDVEY